MRVENFALITNDSFDKTQMIKIISFEFFFLSRFIIKTANKTINPSLRYPTPVSSLISISTFWSIVVNRG